MQLYGFFNVVSIGMLDVHKAAGFYLLLFVVFNGLKFCRHSGFVGEATGLNLPKTAQEISMGYYFV